MLCGLSKEHRSQSLAPTLQQAQAPLGGTPVPYSPLRAVGLRVIASSTLVLGSPAMGVFPFKAVRVLTTRTVFVPLAQLPERQKQNGLPPTRPLGLFFRANGLLFSRKSGGSRFKS